MKHDLYCYSPSPLSPQVICSCSTTEMLDSKLDDYLCGKSPMRRNIRRGVICFEMERHIKTKKACIKLFSLSVTSSTPCLNKHTRCEVRKKNIARILKNIYSLYRYIQQRTSSFVGRIYPTYKIPRDIFQVSTSFVTLPFTRLNRRRLNISDHLILPPPTYTRKILASTRSFQSSRFDRGGKKERIRARFTAPFQGQRTLLPRGRNGYWSPLYRR